MKTDRNTAIEQMPRRTLLKIGLYAAGAGALLAAAPAAAGTKLSQRAAAYQTTPKGAQRCDNCNQWQAPNACKIVDGEISASGWCRLYVAKH